MRYAHPRCLAASTDLCKQTSRHYDARLHRPTPLRNQVTPLNCETQHLFFHKFKSFLLNSFSTTLNGPRPLLSTQTRQFSFLSLVGPPYQFWQLITISRPMTRLQPSACISDEYQPPLIFLSQATRVFIKKSPIFNHFRALSLISERLSAFF